LDVTGAATLSSTLDVTGAATFSSTLDVTGAATFSGSVTATGAVNGSNLSGTNTGNVCSSNHTSGGYMSNDAKTFGNSDGITTISSGKNTSDWPYPTYTDFKQDVYGRDNNIKHWDYLIARLYSQSNNDNDGINYGFECRGNFNSSTTTHISDDRLKHNEINITNGLEIIRKLVPQKYDKTHRMLDKNYKGDLDYYNKEAGIIAQDLLKIDELKDYVSLGSSRPRFFEDEENPHGVDYNSVFTYGLAAVKELDVVVQELKNKNETLENELSSTKSELADLKALLQSKGIIEISFSSR
jgi:hypothetical protein